VPGQIIPACMCPEVFHDLFVGFGSRIWCDNIGSHEQRASGLGYAGAMKIKYFPMYNEHCQSAHVWCCIIGVYAVWSVRLCS